MRSRRDVDDLDDTLFDREAAAERRRDREADRVLAVERGVQLDEQDRILKARAKAAFVGTSSAMILADYHHAGVEPPAGTLVSLPLLLSIGWRIEELPHGIKTLVAPPPREKYVARGECS